MSHRRAMPALLLPFLAALLSIFVPVGAITATTAVRLVWDANAESDLAGYIILYGTEQGVHTESIDVGNVTTYRIDNLPEGILHYFAAVAYDVAGNWSPKSN